MIFEQPLHKQCRSTGIGFWVLCCLMAPGPRKDIWRHISPWSFLFLQITTSDIRPNIACAVSLVTTNDNLIFFRSLCGYVWVSQPPPPSLPTPHFSLKRIRTTTLAWSIFPLATSIALLGDTYLITWMTNPPHETERAPVKNKISFPYCFFYSNPPSQSCFWSTAQTSQRTVSLLKCLVHAQCHRSRLTSIVT